MIDVVRYDGLLDCKDSGVSNAVTERLLKSQNSLN